ncbi:MAG: type II secretion system inner membrane protein GspF [Nitrospirae bacterium]|nr:type II secretion system inner membrane protein GspF [Nitrospirota bacterium]
MSVYEYKGLTPEGRAVSGVIDADSPRLARSKLRKTGIFPTDVLESDAPAAAPDGRGAQGTPLTEAGRQPAVHLFERWGRWRRSHLSLPELSVMTRQLSTMIGAGLPLMDGLTSLIEQIDRQQARKIWIGVREGVKEGASLADALSLHPDVFSSLYLNMVRSGEQSGTLGVMLLRLAEMLEYQARLRSRILAAVTYPVVLLVVSLSILFFLILFVMPQIAQVFTDVHQALPLPTQILLGTSQWLRDYWWALALLLAGGLMWAQRALSSPEGRLRRDRWLLKLPIFGRLAGMVALSRFALTLSTLLASGIPLLRALGIVKGVVGNMVLEGAIEEAAHNIREGESIAGPLQRSGLFPGFVIQMIAVGERSGELTQMLKKVADAYDHQVETTVGVLTSLLTPVLILFMGGIVMIIVLSVLLPIFDMSQTVR